MRLGLAYDLKEAMAHARIQKAEDALEEYDSPETIDAIDSVFTAQGHLVLRLGGGRCFLSRVLQEKVDFVFNIAEGAGNYRSREAQVPSVLEILDIPYAGSDPQCLAICLDKPLTKKLVASAGICTPEWMVFSDIGQLKSTGAGIPDFPLFVKPAWEGSSKGIRNSSRIKTLPELKETVGHILSMYNQPAMVEQYIAGAEVTVGVVGNDPPQVVGVMQIIPRQPTPDFVYSIEVKRNWEKLVEYHCPASLPENVVMRIEKAALGVFRVLGCRDFSRIDFRITDNGEPYFLEINPLPGLNPHSGDLPIMAGKMGWSYDRLLVTILDAAIARYR